MKTFDEALKAVAASPVLLENFGRGEEIQSEEFTGAITALADHFADRMATSRDPFDAFSLLCSTLHAAFKFGLLVGMEMEKAAGEDAG